MLPVPTQHPLNPHTNDTHGLFLFYLLSWHNFWALLFASWKSIPLSVSYLTFFHMTKLQLLKCLDNLQEQVASMVTPF